MGGKGVENHSSGGKVPLGSVSINALCWYGLDLMAVFAQFAQIVIVHHGDASLPDTIGPRY